eukprot:6557699-Prymnesium_polylepis.1
MLLHGQMTVGICANIAALDRVVGTALHHYMALRCQIASGFHAGRWQFRFADARPQGLHHRSGGVVKSWKSA